MVTLTEITNKIIALNSTHFQEMCDEIIIRRYPNHKSFSRSGMAKAVDETKVGTPDSYILLENDMFIFNEHTKAKSKKFTKLKGDFESCINENKAGANVNSIQEINFCISFTIPKEETAKLSELCRKKGITMGLWDIDRLARNILYENPDLANQYLSIPLDKSQWILLKSFVKNYNKAGKSIAAPLDNPFYYRDSEIAETQASIENNHLTIVSGPPGVGKSKLAVEILKNLQQRDNDLIIWVNSFDSASIIDDLSSKLSSKENIILFVDDAHRSSHFQQLLKFLRNSTYGNIKLIVTVRDYALSDFKQLIYNYDHNIITIKSLKDEQIKEIITEVPFNITSQTVQQKILFLGRGNLRLILMLAGLKDASKNMDGLNDSAEAFDFHFRTLLDDADFLAQPSFVKTMTIVTFFNTLKLSDQEFLDKLTISFKISKDTILSCIDELEKMELLSIHNDEVKVSEQNLGFYLFNKAFFKDDILRFENLLQDFYPKHRTRFKDCVISANNNFGHKNLVKKIKPDLLSFLNSTELQEDELVSFYDLFWFAIPDRTISFIVERSLLGEVNINATFDFYYKTNDFAYERDGFLSLIIPFIREHTEYFVTAIQSSLEYVRRNPKKANELLYTLKEHLSFGYNDVQYGYYKQQELLKILKNGFSENKSLEKELFYEISKTLLKHSFQKFEPTYNDNTISFYTYPQQYDQVIEELRIDIWDITFDNFDQYPSRTISLLNSCATQHPDNNQDLMYFDLDYIVRIINEKLNPDNFSHCRYVHKQIWWLRRCNVEKDYFDSILNQFNCELYQFYLTMDSEYLYGQHRFENKLYTDHEKYSQEKSLEIESYLEQNFQNDINRFYDSYSEILGATNNKWSLRESSFESAVCYLFKRDRKNIFLFLDKIITDNNSVNYIPYKAFKLFANNFDVFKKIYDLISGQKFQRRTIWLSQLIGFAESKKLLQFLEPKIVIWAKGIDENCTVLFSNLDKYLEYNEKLYQDLIPIIIDKIEEGYHIGTFRGFPKIMIDSLDQKIESLKRLYYLQDLSDNLFDFQGETFAEICKVQPVFLKEYFEFIYNVPKHKRPPRESRDHFNFIWTNPDLRNKLNEVLDFIIEKEPYYGISDHKAGDLFKNLKAENKEIAITSLRKYMLDNSYNTKRLNAVMDIIHKNFPNEVSSFLKVHLIKNKSLEVFKNVRWIVSQAIWSGDTNPELVRASRWGKVLEFVNEMKDDIQLFPIKNYIKEEILRQKEYANYEKRWR